MPTYAAPAASKAPTKTSTTAASSKAAASTTAASSKAAASATAASSKAAVSTTTTSSKAATSKAAASSKPAASKTAASTTAASTTAASAASEEEDEWVPESGEEEEEEEENDVAAINTLFESSDEQQESSAEDEADELVSPDGSWLRSAKIKKSIWKQRLKWRVRMRRMLPSKDPTHWTMKRYLKALCQKQFGKAPPKANTAIDMGRLLDKYLDKQSSKQTASPKKTGSVRQSGSPKKTRWATKMDTARLLGVMFGTADMRRKFVMSKQPLSRHQIDSRLEETPAQKYWSEVSKSFSDKANVVPIGVNCSTVTAYVQVKILHVIKKFCTSNEEFCFVVC